MTHCCVGNGSTPVGTTVVRHLRGSSLARRGKRHIRAWQFTNTHEPLVLADVPVPVAGPGQVVLDVVSAGLCHSDVGVLEDEVHLPGPPPTTGHDGPRGRRRGGGRDRW